MATTTQVLCDHLSATVRRRLEENGCFVRIGPLTHEWAARISATGGLANPQFRDSNISESDSRCAMLFQCPSDTSKPDELIGAICWRFHTTDDYIREFETGRLYYETPEAAEWPHLLTGLRDELSFLKGYCCTRGAIRSFRETTPDRPGWRLIWWLSMFPMIEAIQERVNYQVGIPWKHIGDRDAPRKWYGYQHQVMSRPLLLPFKNKGTPVMTEPSPLYFAWSDLAETIQIMARRLRRLQSAGDQHLRDIAIPDEKLDQSQETAVRNVDGLLRKLAAEQGPVRP